jgi:methionyl aminopeptidase
VARVTRRTVVTGILGTLLGCKRTAPQQATRAEETIRIAPIVSRIVGELGRSLRPGLSTKDVEHDAIERLHAADLDPRMLGYRGFPAAIGVSIDEEVLHGIPSQRRLENGQLVKIQLGARTARGTADLGWTFGLGEIDEEKKHLCQVAIQALRDALASLRAGTRTGDLGATIQGTLESGGLSAIRDFVGYRIGEQPIEGPQLPCYGKRGHGETLEAGAFLHVHVIAAAGGWRLSIKDDRWTAVTQDGRPSALFTAVARARADGCDLLTPLLA